MDVQVLMWDRVANIQMRLLPDATLFPLSSVVSLSFAFFVLFYEIFTFCFETLEPLNGEV